MKRAFVSFALAAAFATMGFVAGCESRTQPAAKNSSEEVREAANELAQAIDKAVASKEKREALSNLNSAIADSMQEAADKSSGAERELALTIKRFTQRSESANVAFQTAFAATQDERILDYTSLDSPERYAFHVETLQSYVKQSGKYYDSTRANIKRLEKELTAIGSENEAVMSTLASVKQGFEIQEPVFKPLMTCHADYGKAMLAMVQFLQERTGTWKFTPKGFEFGLDEDVDEYTELSDQMRKLKKELKRLSAEQQKIISGAQ